jgi:cyclohexyl-isocyanide hydratase
MDRRLFAKVFAALGVVPGVSPVMAAKDDKKPPANAADAAVPPDVQGDPEQAAIYARNASFLSGPRYQIGIVVYPSMNMIDLVGALAVFECLIDKDIHLISRTQDLIGLDGLPSSSIIPVKPNSTYETCPNNLDVLFVPGGVAGAFGMMEDEHLMRFLAFHGQRARFVSSVSTGSLLLAAAGVLKGYRATTHWPLREVLQSLGAKPSKGRVVVDRNRLTGNGPSSGIDLGLQVVARLKDKAFAEAVQLMLEYEPDPPFQSGSPAKAPVAVRRFLQDMYAEITKSAHLVATRVLGKLPS